MDCPLCFADAKPGFSLTLEEVETMLDDYVRTEGNPEVIQFSGGEPTIHPQIIDFQTAFHAGRRMQHDPMQRMSIPDIVRLIEEQTAGKFVASDFIPVPCCFPTCNLVTPSSSPGGVLAEYSQCRFGGPCGCGDSRQDSAACSIHGISVPLR